VWNGEEFSKVIVKQTGENQKLITVSTSRGMSLRCTPYHKFWIDEGIPLEVEAKDLKPGMCIIKYKLPENENEIDTDYIVSIEDHGDVDDTYCFTEPLKHRGIFNGILTGQCAEIQEVSTKDETSVCNLASVSLPKFLNSDTKKYDFNELHRVIKIMTKNLNRVIDRNFYPVDSGS